MAAVADGRRSGGGGGGSGGRPVDPLIFRQPVDVKLRLTRERLQRGSPSVFMAARWSLTRIVLRFLRLFFL